MNAEPSPYLTVGQLRDLLAGWPDDRPVLVGTVAGAVARVVYSCHETAEGTGAAGAFRTVARPSAEYLDTDPPRLGPQGEFDALVLRGEVVLTDDEVRIEMSALHMSQLLPTMRALIAEGWTMREMTKPMAEGVNGELVRATFVRGEGAGDEAHTAATPDLA